MHLNTFSSVRLHEAKRRNDMANTYRIHPFKTIRKGNTKSKETMKTALHLIAFYGKQLFLFPLVNSCCEDQSPC